MRKKKLSDKNKAFAEYYLSSLNAYESAIKAGYSENYAKASSYKLLDNDGIKQYIAERMEEASKKRIASAEQVMLYLTNVMFGEEKDQFGLDASISDRNKAAEMLGKIHGLFKEKKSNEEGNKVSEAIEKLAKKVESDFK